MEFCCKARLVVHGSRQIYGLDYNKFSPEVQKKCLRIFLAIAVEMSYDAYHVDKVGGEVI